MPFNQIEDGDGEVMDGFGLEIVGVSIGSMKSELLNEGLLGGASMHGYMFA